MNIVITGASKGIGYEMASYLSGNHRVFAISRNETLLKKLQRQSGESSGLIPIVCDLTDSVSVEKAVAIISKEVNHIDVLINNAGMLLNKSFRELSPDDWQSVYDVNVFGVVQMTRYLMPLLEKGNYHSEKKVKSHVLNISSMGGIQGSMKFKGLSAYSSGKGALITLTECLAEEFKDIGIRVNVLALGSVETEMFQSAFPGMKASEDPISISRWIADFALSGGEFFNGKVLPVSTSNP